MWFSQVALALLSSGGCVHQKDLDALAARVEALEQDNLAYETRLADLEEQLTSLQYRMTNLSVVPAPGAPADPEQETAAAELLKRASDAFDAMNTDEAKAALAELESRYPDTRANRAAVRLREELDIVGITAPPLDVERWFQGTAADAKGKITLYVFFEVWCPHCKRELPKLSETYTALHDKGLAIVALTKLTRDITEEQLTTFISENRLPYPVAKEKGDSLSQAYGVRGIPAAAVVKDGKVIWRGHPAKLTAEKIEGWL